MKECKPYLQRDHMFIQVKRGHPGMRVFVWVLLLSSMNDCGSACMCACDSEVSKKTVVAPAACIVKLPLYPLLFNSLDLIYPLQGVPFSFLNSGFFARSWFTGGLKLRSVSFACYPAALKAWIKRVKNTNTLCKVKTAMTPSLMSSICVVMYLPRMTQFEPKNENGTL